MAYQVLARKYRPQRFSDVAGQDHVTNTLRNALTQGRTAHGYIFSGHRGIGKTTIARILAMALNCRSEVGSMERPTVEPCLTCISCREISSASSAESGNEAMHAFDFIEIDAASNRGIDDVRSIRSQAMIQPTRDRYKVFLLDEAHQITDAAFNAILKTLEEPPEWAVFMMATTEPENIPQTIRSRCQHFSFHAVKFEDILGQLKQIAAAENLKAEDAALAMLAEAGDGSMRDALSIMDQAIASAPVEDGQPVLSALQIRELMGSVPNTVFERMMETISAGDPSALMLDINELLNAGHSPSSLARQFVRYLRNALMAKLGGEQTELLQISSDERARANRTALLFSEEELTRSLNTMLRTFDDLNYRQEQRLHLELGLMKMVMAQRLLPIEELLSGAKPTARPAVTAPARTSAPGAGTTRPSAPPSAREPQLSPFEADQQRRQQSTTPGETMSAATPEPIAIVERPVMRAATAAPILEAPVKAAGPVLVPSPTLAIPPQSSGIHETEGALARAAEPAERASFDEARDRVSDALDEAEQATAAGMIQASQWSEGAAGLVIEVPMRPKMIELTFNPAADKIIRNVLRELGLPNKYKITSNESLGAAPAKQKIVQGSIQSVALDHPLVQYAQKIFGAEVQTVLDLRSDK